jgi:four helix bundle protein
MREERENLIVAKSYTFALKIIELYRHLIEQREYVLSKQVLRCGTSIGANIHEAMAGVSKKDFVNKLSISVKEARETSYWLNLLKDSKFISVEKYEDLITVCNSIIKILNSIILTTKEKYLSDS